MPLKLALIALVPLFTACPSLPPPDNCPPRAQRCSPAGAPQVCSVSAPTSWVDMNRPCREISAVCCEVPSVYDPSRKIFACVPMDRCLAQDGGLP